MVHMRHARGVCCLCRNDLASFRSLLSPLSVCVNVCGLKVVCVLSVQISILCSFLFLLDLLMARIPVVCGICSPMSASVSIWNS